MCRMKTLSVVPASFSTHTMIRHGSGNSGAGRSRSAGAGCSIRSTDARVARLSNQQLVDEFSARTGYTFEDPSHLAGALTHPSFAARGTEAYQRLEFLGDRVLGLVIAEVLKVNDIQVDAAMVRERVEQFAQSYEDPQEVIDYYYSNQEQLANIQNVVLEEQVVAWVESQVKVVDEATDFEAVMNPPAPAAAEEEAEA